MQRRIGVTWGGMAHADGQFTWWVKYYGRQLASGVAESKSAAAHEVTAAVGKIMVSTTDRAHARSRLQMKMQRYLEKRPYLVAHVLAELVRGSTASEVVSSAEAREQEIHDGELESTGSAVPISRHHSALQASDAAMKILDLAQKLGLQGKALLNYGKKYLGPVWIEIATGQEPVEAMQARADEAAEEDDAA